MREQMDREISISLISKSFKVMFENIGKLLSFIGIGFGIGIVLAIISHTLGGNFIFGFLVNVAGMLVNVFILMATYTFLLEKFKGRNCSISEAFQISKENVVNGWLSTLAFVLICFGLVLVYLLVSFILSKLGFIGWILNFLLIFVFITVANLVRSFIYLDILIEESMANFKGIFQIIKENIFSLLGVYILAGVIFYLPILLIYLGFVAEVVKSTFFMMGAFNGDASGLIWNMLSSMLGVFLLGVIIAIVAHMFFVVLNTLVYGILYEKKYNKSIIATKKKTNEFYEDVDNRYDYSNQHVTETKSTQDSVQSEDDDLWND